MFHRDIYNMKFSLNKLLFCPYHVMHIMQTHATFFSSPSATYFSRKIGYFLCQVTEQLKFISANFGKD